LSHDEEVGCIGVRRLLERHISGLEVKPKALYRRRAHGNESGDGPQRKTQPALSRTRH
jgi:hypothetical protein